MFQIECPKFNILFLRRRIAFSSINLLFSIKNERKKLIPPRIKYIVKREPEGVD